MENNNQNQTAIYWLKKLTHVHQGHVSLKAITDEESAELAEFLTKLNNNENEQ